MMGGRRFFTMGGAALLAVFLAGCDDGKPPFGAGLFGSGVREASADAPAGEAAVRIVERDVEAPEVLQLREPGLWDGRPSIGGVWVAHPDVDDPERVLIRNTVNDSFVIGALFRRERLGGGPRLQISSDTADALGLVAGQPTLIEVTALRREKVADQPAVAPDADAPDAVQAAAADSDAAAPAAVPPGAISAAPLASAAAALDRVEAQTAPPDQAETPPEAPAPPARPASGLEKPFVQIGFFSVRANAEATGARLRANGILPTIREHQSSGKTYWRVLVGPVTNQGDRAEVQQQVRALGFRDAYFVTD